LFWLHAFKQYSHFFCGRIEGSTERTDAKLKVVERMNVDDLQLTFDRQGELHNSQHVMIVLST